MKQIKEIHTYTNNTAAWHLVGNCNELISSHLDSEHAHKALEGHDVDSGPWGTISIVEPGQTVSGTFVQPVDDPGYGRAPLADD